mgnify:FL=1
MNTKQIYQILKSDKILQQTNFLGVFPSDKIPELAKTTYPCSAVVNTMPHTHSGLHWVAFFKTKYNYGIYFDSYGFPPYNLPAVGDVLDTCKDWSFNSHQLQTLFSTICGQYTIFFLTHICRGFSLDHIIQLLNDSGDTYANDAFIFSYINNKYRQHNVNELHISDPSLLYNQTSIAQHF